MSVVRLTSLASCVLLLVLLPYFALVEGISIRRIARQAQEGPLVFPDGTKIPLRIAGGRDAFRPSVGALSSFSGSQSLNEISDRNRPAPPIVFGPRPRPNRQRFPRPQSFRPWFRFS